MLLEAVVRIYSSKISQYSQENTCVGVSLFKKVATFPVNIFYYFIASRSVVYFVPQKLFDLTFSFGEITTLTFLLRYFSVYTISMVIF